MPLASLLPISTNHNLRQCRRRRLNSTKANLAISWNSRSSILDHWSCPRQLSWILRGLWALLRRQPWQLTLPLLGRSRVLVWYSKTPSMLSDLKIQRWRALSFTFPTLIGQWQRNWVEISSTILPSRVSSSWRWWGCHIFVPWYSIMHTLYACHPYLLNLSGSHNFVILSSCIFVRSRSLIYLWCPGVACAKTGKVAIASNIAKGPEGEQVFKESRSILFKDLRVQRIYDEQENTVVYVSFSTRLDKSDDNNKSRFKSSLCAVNLNDEVTSAPPAAAAQ